MNESLEFYKNDEKVMSITGYTYPCKMPNDYDKDVLIFYRSSSWGWATWKNEWNTIDFNITIEHEIFNNKILQKQFNRGGDDLFEMLKMQMDGKINSWAIRFALFHSLTESFTLYPSKSLVKNIGHDESGTHCATSTKWDVALNDKFIPRLVKINLDNKIVKCMQKKLNATNLQKIKSYIRKIIK